MHGKARTILVQASPAILISIVLVIRRFQLELGHLLSMAYLFWDYVLVAAIATLVCVSLFSRRLRIAGLLAGAVLCAEFTSPTLIDWHRNSGPASGPTLKVISFNWLLDERDRSEIYAWLREQDADIVALQEFIEPERGVAAALYGMFPYHTKPASDQVILSKYPVLRQTSKALENNSLLRAELEVQGRRLVVWGIHPATLKELPELKARDHYLSEVAFYVERETEPVLMMGDFNATRWDPAFQAIVSAGALHQQPALLAPPTRMAVRKGLPFLGSPIDHILTNGRNVLSDCHTGPNLGSDHKPLICNLQLSD